MKSLKEQREEIVGELEEIFPLQWFATSDYLGSTKDGELNFKMWQDSETILPACYVGARSAT